jgi:hypothetical protein
MSKNCVAQNVIFQKGRDCMGEDSESTRNLWLAIFWV